MTNFRKLTDDGSILGDMAFSPDDGGFYVEVIRRTGRVLGCTEVHPTQDEAWAAAERMVAELALELEGV